MKLTKNFYLEEFEIKKEGYQSQIPKEYQYKIFLLCVYDLQPIRDVHGKVIVTSGYRTYYYNKLIGGAPNSQHMIGEAADIVTPDADLFEVFMWAKDNLTYGQLIFEDKKGKRWIHISLPRIGREPEALMFKDGKYLKV